MYRKEKPGNRIILICNTVFITASKKKKQKKISDISYTTEQIWEIQSKILRKPILIR
jgi:hypothetical protein